MRAAQFVVTKLDRLGRSTRELLELIERIGKAGASFRSLGDPLWDTSSSRGRLLSTLLDGAAHNWHDGTGAFLVALASPDRDLKPSSVGTAKDPRLGKATLPRTGTRCPSWK